MWGTILSVVTGPLFGTLLKGYVAKLQANGQHDNKVVELAAKEMELDGLEARLNNQRKGQIDGKWYTPENLSFYFIGLPYWFTAITVDYIISPLFGWDHTTGALHGDTAVVMGMIMGFWLGKRTVMSVATVIADAFGKR